MLRVAAAERNRQPILKVLQDYINSSPTKYSFWLFEIASGSGQHAYYFASHFPNLIIQPSEIDPSYISSINAYREKFKLPNLLEPIIFDVSKPLDHSILPKDFRYQIDIVLSINLIHISSNAAVDGLFMVSKALLKHGTGKLITYGAYAADGQITPQSNVDFDSGLRASNSEWGLRDIAELKQKASCNGLSLISIHDMPANNKMLIFKYDM
ncbi:unnamed protein product [Dracunculus medinensis]|uniref:Methyltransferase-like 26 n=1 Tax=Dracunculus medinensis TaxID=318479 RepID=A0A0N4UBD5_DRAME|nr:unnamed protein product [Dracunculus medinensis]